MNRLFSDFAALTKDLNSVQANSTRAELPISVLKLVTTGDFLLPAGVLPTNVKDDESEPGPLLDEDRDDGSDSHSVSDDDMPGLGQGDIIIEGNFVRIHDWLGQEWSGLIVWFSYVLIRCS